MTLVRPIYYNNGVLTVIQDGDAIDPDVITGASGSGAMAVRAASTGNVDISAPGTTMDGVTLVSGDLIMLKDQTTASQNGVYVFNGAVTPATRYSGLDADAEATTGLLVTVAEGNINGTSLWMLATYQPITIGTTALTFMLLSVGGTTNISIDVTVDFGTIPTTSKKFTATIPGLTVGQRIDVAASGYTPTGVDFDEAEFEAILWVAKVLSNDQLTLIGNSSSPVKGQRIVQVTTRVNSNTLLTQSQVNIVPDYILQGAGVQ